MKAINVSELKAHLSKYLRLASRGACIVVKDRDEPIAQHGPPQAEALAWRDRLAREGRLRLRYAGVEQVEDFQARPARRDLGIT